MIEAGEDTVYVRAGWEFMPEVTLYIEAVHRLSDQGAVVTFAAYGTTRDGFDAEWRAVTTLTVDGDLINRCEIFDEVDLGTALAKFEQLSRPAPHLENTASQVAERFQAHYAAGDWDTIAEILAHDFSSDDRREVVGAGIRHGRDAQVASLRATAEPLDHQRDVGPHGDPRGRLVLMRASFSGRDQGPEAFLTEVLVIVEINADERVVAVVSFDLDDFEAAIAELDARYLAGEAADHAHTWSVIARGHAVLNRRELPPLTTDLVSIDHRRGPAFAPGEGIQYLQCRD